MIRQLRIRNFKSWADTGELRFAPLTGFFGTNSSGKSSVLQALLMLKQTAESQDRKQVLHTGDERSLVDLGTYSDIICGHLTGSPLALALTWDLPKRLSIMDPEKRGRTLYQANRLSFEAAIREAEGRPVLESFTYHIDAGPSFGMARRPGEPGKEKYKGKYDLHCQGYEPKRIQGRPWPLPEPVKCYGFPDEATGYYQNTGFLSLFPLEFEALLGRTAYLGPLREYPKRTYVWAGQSPSDVGRRGEQTVAALLASRAEGKTISRGKGKRRQSVDERVAEWLQELGMVHSFSLQRIAKNRKDYEVRVRGSASSAEVLITDVGFGVSQMLPVLVLCYFVPEGSIILLEQPEIHLHPSVQAGLADVLIDAVKTRNVQIILESHSEHLLRRVQRRIAEERLGNSDTALYFCRVDDGVSVIEELNLDLFGNITNWPTDFFGDDMGELSAMTEAATKRKGVK